MRHARQEEGIKTQCQEYQRQQGGCNPPIASSFRILEEHQRHQGYSKRRLQQTRNCNTDESQDLSGFGLIEDAKKQKSRNDQRWVPEAKTLQHFWEVESEQDHSNADDKPRLSERG